MCDRVNAALDRYVVDPVGRALGAILAGSLSLLVAVVPVVVGLGLLYLLVQFVKFAWG